MKICSLCEKEIKEGEPVQLIQDNQEVHDDCYYKKLGEIVEQHPIVNPTRIRRLPTEAQ